MLYLTISEGEAPDRAKPLLATGDETIIRHVAQALAERCGLPPTGKRKLFAINSKALKDGPPQGQG